MREGVLDAASCKKVTKAFGDWGIEIPWLTLYFVICTNVSLYLAEVPDFVVKGLQAAASKVAKIEGKSKAA